MAYRNLSAALEQIELLRTENADLRARLGPQRDWLRIWVKSVLVLGAGTIGTVSWWLVTS